MRLKMLDHYVRADELKPIVSAGPKDERERQFLRKQGGFYDP